MESLSIVNDLVLDRKIQSTWNANKQLQGKSILYIDDDYVNFLYFSELLSETGASILRAFSYTQALVQLAMECQLCLVIISESSITETNYQIVSQINSIAPQVPVIGIIETNSNKHTHKFLEIGCDLYLNRHIDSVYLVEVVNELVENSREK